jgi:hypothetical protein
LEYDGEKARKQSNKSDEYLEKMKVLKQNKLKKMIKKYKISINSLSGIYVNSLETAISNSNITKFYKRYYNVFFKTNKNSIPFPKDKLSTDISNSLDKLNSLIKIFEKYGFIWGGKWNHYDTMHFEYRPELLD